MSVLYVGVSMISVLLSFGLRLKGLGAQRVNLSEPAQKQSAGRLLLWNEAALVAKFGDFCLDYHRGIPALWPKKWLILNNI